MACEWIDDFDRAVWESWLFEAVMDKLEDSCLSIMRTRGLEGIYKLKQYIRKRKSDFECKAIRSHDMQYRILDLDAWLVASRFTRHYEKMAFRYQWMESRMLQLCYFGP